MATSCSTIQDKLSAYLDNELDLRWQAEVNNHLSTCPPCQRELEALRQTMHVMQAWEAPVVSPRVSAAFCQKVEERTARPQSWARVFGGGWQRVAWAAGVAVVVLATGVAYRQGQQRIPPHRIAGITSSTPSKSREGAILKEGGAPPMAKGDDAPRSSCVVSPESPEAEPRRPEEPRSRERVSEVGELYAATPAIPVEPTEERAVSYAKDSSPSATFLSKGGAPTMGKETGEVPIAPSDLATAEIPDATSALVACLTEAPQPAAVATTDADRLSPGDAIVVEKTPSLFLTELLSEAE